MLVKSFATKIRGGNAFRVILAILHLFLGLAFGVLTVCYLFETYLASVGTIGLLEKIGFYRLSETVHPILDMIRQSNPLPVGKTASVLVLLALLTFLTLRFFCKLFRRRFIHCISEVGTIVYSCGYYQRFSPLALPADVYDGEPVYPDFWYTDREFYHPANAYYFMKGKSIVLFGAFDDVVEELEEDEADAPATAPDAPLAPLPVSAPSSAPLDNRPPEIQTIIREAEMNQKIATLETEVGDLKQKVDATAPLAKPAEPALVPAEPVAPPVKAAPVPAPAESAVAAPAPAVVAPALASEGHDDDSDDDGGEIREMEIDGVTRQVLIRYSRSFTARVIQAPDTLKAYYSEVKNELMSYQLVKSRISWKHDAFNSGRHQLAKLVVRGKNLYIYLALDPKAYDPDKYHHVDRSDRNAYAKVPMMIKVKSDLGLRKAKFLISEVMAAVGLERGEEQSVDYAAWYAYRDTKTLIAEDLIKELEPTPI